MQVSILLYEREYTIYYVYGVALMDVFQFLLPEFQYLSSGWSAVAASSVRFLRQCNVPDEMLKLKKIQSTHVRVSWQPKFEDVSQSVSAVQQQQQLKGICILFTDLFIRTPVGQKIGEYIHSTYHFSQVFPTYFWHVYIYYATNNYLSETVIMVHRNNKELCHIQMDFREQH